MKKKTTICIVIVIAIILLFPILLRLKDSSSIEFKKTEILNTTEERTKLKDVKIKANGIDTTKLVKFKDTLYGKSYAVIDYAGDMSKSLGKIDFLIEEEYLPILEGETNCQEFFGANVLEVNEESMILNVNDIAVLLEKISIDSEKSMTFDYDKEAYTNALKNLCENGIMPDGTMLEEYNLNYDMSENKFAISDIDFDGKDELIIALVQSPMVAMRTIIYDYDISKNKFKEEFTEFPALTFYDNKMIVAEWSHNQGSAGDTLWPYTLYKYVDENDCYEVLAQVDAWDKSFNEKCYIEEEFPKEIDKDGDEIIYYVLQDDYIAYDLKEYEKWKMQYITEDTLKVNVLYMNITEENIYMKREK